MGKHIYNVEVREIVRIYGSSEFTQRESLKIPGPCLFEYRLYVAGSFYVRKTEKTIYALICAHKCV